MIEGLPPGTEVWVRAKIYDIEPEDPPHYNGRTWIELPDMEIAFVESKDLKTVTIYAENTPPNEYL